MYLIYLNKIITIFDYINHNLFFDRKMINFSIYSCLFTLGLSLKAAVQEN